MNSSYLEFGSLKVEDFNVEIASSVTEGADDHWFDQASVVVIVAEARRNHGSIDYLITSLHHWDHFFGVHDNRLIMS